MTNAPNAIERLRGVMESRKEALLRMLPKRVGGGERFAELMLAVVSTPEIAACAPASVVSAAYACARLGLTPDPILGHIYIIPRSVKVREPGQERWEKRANIQIGYKGMIELARRSGIVRSINTEVVYDGDSFRYWTDENGKHLRHEPQLDRAADARPLAVYCVAELSGGGWPQVEVMPWTEVQRIRAGFADEKSPAWKFNEVEMAKKTVVRRASKLWPQSPEIGQAVQWEEQAERGENQTLPDVPEDLPPVNAEQPRRRSLLAPSEHTDDGLPYDDDSPTGDAAPQPEPPSIEGAKEPVAKPTQAPAPASPAQAPTANKRPKAPQTSPKPAPSDTAVAVDDGPTAPNDIADVFVAMKTARENRQYIDTVNAINPAIVAAAMKTAAVLNLDHADESEMKSVAWNVKFAMEGGND